MSAPLIYTETLMDRYETLRTVFIAFLTELQSLSGDEGLNMSALPARPVLMVKRSCVSAREAFEGQVMGF